MLYSRCRTQLAAAARRAASKRSYSKTTRQIFTTSSSSSSSSSSFPRASRPASIASAPRVQQSFIRYQPYSSSAPSTPQKPDFLDEAESHIWDLLVEEFSPSALVVQDISGGCGSMYGIEIESEKFRGANMLKQQRMVNACLGEQVKQWHGVQLRTRVPASS